MAHQHHYQHHALFPSPLPRARALHIQQHQGCPSRPYNHVPPKFGSRRTAPNIAHASWKTRAACPLEVRKRLPTHRQFPRPRRHGLCQFPPPRARFARRALLSPRCAAAAARKRSVRRAPISTALFTDLPARVPPFWRVLTATPQHNAPLRTPGSPQLVCSPPDSSNGRLGARTAHCGRGRLRPNCRPPRSSAADLRPAAAAHHTAPHPPHELTQYTDVIIVRSTHSTARRGVVPQGRAGSRRQRPPCWGPEEELLGALLWPSARGVPAARSAPRTPPWDPRGSASGPSRADTRARGARHAAARARGGEGRKEEKEMISGCVSNACGRVEGAGGALGRTHPLQTT